MCWCIQAKKWKERTEVEMTMPLEHNLRALSPFSFHWDFMGILKTGNAPIYTFYRCDLSYQTIPAACPLCTPLILVILEYSFPDFHIFLSERTRPTLQELRAGNSEVFSSLSNKNLTIFRVGIRKAFLSLTALVVIWVIITPAAVTYPLYLFTWQLSLTHLPHINQVTLQKMFILSSFFYN